MSHRETQLPPAVVFEDDHFLVVHKPAGWNTHAPAPHAGEGIYEWLKHREPRWARLSILHRLDKETSGLLVFGKTTAANQSLTRQFTERAIDKRYLLRTHRPVTRDRFTVQSRIVRVGDRYEGLPGRGSGTEPGEWAETEFRVLSRSESFTELEARPVTGRTHQIRVHAAAEGFPILGDALYGGAPHARVCLASVELAFEHPVLGQTCKFEAPPEFDLPPAVARRRALIHTASDAETTAYREWHGAGDGLEPGVYVDRLGEYRLIQRGETAESVEAEKQRWSVGLQPGEGVYLKRLDRHVRQSTPEEVAPQWLAGASAPERFEIRENGVRYELAFNEGYSVGLFLDQRDNRRRLLVNHVGADFPAFESGAVAGQREVLNTFAYTCAFSVCAALGGARTTSLDLSRKYLEWGRRNFELNGLDSSAHDFIYGDCFEWMRRLAKKGRRFDAVLLDPPTFSRSKEHGDFRTERDYGELVENALMLLKPGGLLFASTNTARWAPERFLDQVHEAIGHSQRRILRELYVPQPPDFPVNREEPAYLKTVWIRVS